MKKYNVILADPPWHYKVWSEKTGSGRSASSHYNTMSQKDIDNLNIDKIAEKDCALFLWVTSPCLIEGINLINAWGFQYKTIAFTWVKRNKKSDSYFWGMGYYTRANVELCLLATRGKPLKRVSKAVHQIIDDRIREHSQKPDSVREKIVKLFGDIPRIELFARDRCEGWDAIGEELDGKDIREILK